MPRQSVDESIRCFVRLWPRAKTGSNISITRRELVRRDCVFVTNISATKEYSAEMLSIRARLKFRKGTSRPWIDGWVLGLTFAFGFVVVAWLAFSSAR